MTDGTKTLSVVFFAVMRSADLFTRLGPERGWNRVQGCFTTIRKVTERYSGTFIKQITMDKALCTFPDPAAAVSAAAEIQEAFGGHAAEIPGAAGISYGEVLWESGDVFGHTVHIAARILEQAKGAQILAAAEAIAALPVGFEPDSRHIDRMPAKGIEAPIDVHEVLWDTEDVTTIGPPVVRRAVPQRLRLRCGDQQLDLDGTSGSVSLGRADDADIRTDDTLASRIHLRIEKRRDKFVATDESANGTYLEMNGNLSRLARKESVTLSGSGRLALGGTFDQVREAIEFECIDG